jgi:sugar/nucleoside kinase (ribokinase family)
MLETHTAVVAGHLCLDVIPSLAGRSQDRFETMFVPGHLIHVGPATLATGGPVSNTGLALHKLGIRTQLMGKVGDDLFGQAVRQIVASHAPYLADGMVIDSRAHTSYTIVINAPDVDRIFLHYPGANDTFSADDIRYDLLAETSLFHFGYPPLMRLMFEDNGAQLVDVYRRAKQTGITTSLDMAVPDPAAPAGRADWATILRAVLPHVDIFLPSIEEILYMLRRSTFDQLARAGGGARFLAGVTAQLLSDVGQQLLDMGTRIIGLKLGECGFYVRTAGQSALQRLGRAGPADLAAWADQELWAPCFKVNVVGTAGSGDSTIAGFLTALLRGLGPAEALTAAVAVGACNVEAADTLSGVRPWEETMERVAAGWARHDLRLTAAGWQFDRDYQLWRKE